MIVIKNRAEEKLDELLLTTDHAMRIPSPALSDTEWNAKKEAELIECIGKNHDRTIEYCIICRNGDFILLGDGLSLPVYKTVALSVARLLNISTDLITFYEPGHSWYQLKLMCQHHLDSIEKEKEAKQRYAREQHKVMLRRAALEQVLPGALLASLQGRRYERDHIEITVVEDDAFSRKLVCNALGKGFSVSTAENAKSAIAAHATKASDIIFLDIDLPDASGHDVMRRILEFDPNAYIIMLSGNGDRENVLSAMNKGAKGFIAKPFTKEKLRHYIEQCPTYTPEKVRSEPCA